jgi:uncharacterized membrane protein YdjX (TVP38/TMEM64 family)
MAPYGCVLHPAGPLKGTALVSASATLGASLAFLVSRYIARPAVEKRLEGEAGGG